MTRLLVVTAVAAERAAVLGARVAEVGSIGSLPVHRCDTPAGPLDVVAGGVGAVAAALSTASVLGGPAEPAYDLVIAAGIGGGFAGVGPGEVVVADLVAHADLGAETATGGFSSLTELGWGPVRFATDARLAERLAGLTAARTGTVLTVSTVTGTQERADRLLAEYPNALAEGMEGAGVCQAAALAGVPFAELRTISNQVGPRERASWRIGDALTALASAFDRLLAGPLDVDG